MSGKDENWFELFQKLERYKEEHGHMLVPRSYEALGEWVMRQRALNQEGKLQDVRRGLLNQIGFIWKVPKVDDLWMTQYEKLVAYKMATGHTSVKYSSADDKPLASWVNCQRIYNKSGVLREDRRQLLDEIGFVWEAKQDNADNLWMEHYEKLLAYKSIHGDTLVSKQTFSDEDHALAGWVYQQRYLNNKGKLRTDRRDRLNQIGFVWRAQRNDRIALASENRKAPRNDRVAVAEDNRKVPRNGRVAVASDSGKKRKAIDDAKWMYGYEKLAMYKMKNGDTRVPVIYGTDKSLGKWVMKQRQEHKNGNLREDRKELLNKIDFDWDGMTQSHYQDDRWLESYGKLLEYLEKNGDTLVSCNDPDTALATWVSWQRTGYRKGTLRADRKQLLDEIGFVWAVPRGLSAARTGVASQQRVPSAVAASSKPKPSDDTKWMGKYAELKAYKQTHGDTLVPQIFGAHKSLGKWVSKQRQNNKKGKLRIDRVELLNQIGFDWNASTVSNA